MVQQSCDGRGQLLTQGQRALFLQQNQTIRILKFRRTSAYGLFLIIFLTTLISLICQQQGSIYFFHIPATSPNLNFFQENLQYSQRNFRFQTKQFNQSLILIMKIIVVGGGIAGMTASIASKRLNNRPLIIQRNQSLTTKTFGGGIGLWPTSQMVFQQLGLLEQIQKQSMIMPTARYFNKWGQIIGLSSQKFNKNNKVLCLQRQTLCRILQRECIRLQIPIFTGKSFKEIKIQQKKVQINFQNGKIEQGDLLIGADGINSKVRSIFLQNQGLPEVNATHCNYTYFRAVTEISQTQLKYYENSFQSWGDKIRFGYVPLRPPKVFWFMAIPIGQGGLYPIKGNLICNKQQKQWLNQLISKWRSPVDMNRLIESSQNILRTDIRKISRTTDFPWVNKHRNVILLGDSANATAPNIAQGAGLAIQSAWDLFANKDLHLNLKQYQKIRKKRAKIVQTMADSIALIGQSTNPFRDYIMSSVCSFFPKLQGKIFDQLVCISLGGNFNKLYWIPRKSIFNIPIKICLGHQFNNLPLDIRNYRKQNYAYGKGHITSKSEGLFALFLPKDCQNQPFQAETIIQQNQQKWIRYFSLGLKNASKYETKVSAIKNDLMKSGWTFTETTGILSKQIKFVYNIKLFQKYISYESKGISFFDIKLPFPNFLLPKSFWTQQFLQKGWNFQGRIINAPLFGSKPIMSYKGNFNFKIPILNGKTVIIAGGSGLLGRQVAKEFTKEGWKVYCLTTTGKCLIGQPIIWDPTNTCQKQNKRLSKFLEESDTIINLSGQNPAGLWTSNKKQRILKSRLDAISVLQKACKQANYTKLFLQASAVGIYGHRPQQIIDQQSQISDYGFRAKVCREIEQAGFSVTNNSKSIRLGHLMSSEGGIFPYLNLLSKLGLSLKSKSYFPWVHINDAARAFFFIANNYKTNTNIYNVTSPSHITYQNFFTRLQELKERKEGRDVNFLIRVLGQVSRVLQDSNRIGQGYLKKQGFQYKFIDLRECLCSKQLL